MNINFLDRPIAFHRPFVAITGSVTAALFLSQALYWAKRCKEHDDGCSWFYKTQADWEEETGLTRYEQEGARKALRNLGVLKEKRVGLPAQLYFSIDLVALEAVMNACDFLQPSMRKTSKQARGKPAISSAGNQLSITEITTETTTEIQDPPLVPQGKTRPESETTRRGTRLPNDWFLPAEWGRWAMPRDRAAQENGSCWRRQRSQITGKSLAWCQSGEAGLGENLAQLDASCCQLV